MILISITSEEDNGLLIIASKSWLKPDKAEGFDFMNKSQFFLPFISCGELFYCFINGLV